MNLVIFDGANKKYHPFIHCTETEALFIMGNINKINTKNNTYLIVQQDVDLSEFENKEYKMDQGMFDKLVLEYNSNLKDGEKHLDLWTRG